MTLKVAGVRANLNENIVHAAQIIGLSVARRAIFDAIYRGKKTIKTVDDLMSATGLSRVRVLQEAGKLAGNGIVEKLKVDGRTAYKKDETYVHHKRAVLDLLDHPEKRARYPTKQEPRAPARTTYNIRVSRSQPLPQLITVDDVEAFAEVRKVPSGPKANLSSIPESHIKRFLKRVLGETHDFQDWGGEKNDLYTNKLRFRGARRRLRSKARPRAALLRRRRWVRTPISSEGCSRAKRSSTSSCTTARLTKQSTSRCAPTLSRERLRAIASTTAWLMGMIWRAWSRHI